LPCEGIDTEVSLPHDPMRGAEAKMMHYFSLNVNMNRIDQVYNFRIAITLERRECLMHISQFQIIFINPRV
jgi:hypothetical protein